MRCGPQFVSDAAMYAVSMGIRQAAIGDAERLSDLAARTFGLACPPDLPVEEVDGFIRENLSSARFTEYLGDPSRIVLIAEDDGGETLGYTMLIDRAIDDPRVDEAVTARPAVELSKVYVRSASHGRGVAGPLMRATIDAGLAHGARGMWLGVNQLNSRAVRFYEKSGFTVVGTRRFQVGRRWCDDFVMQAVLRD